MKREDILSPVEKIIYTPAQHGRLSLMLPLQSPRLAGKRGDRDFSEQ